VHNKYSDDNDDDDGCGCVAK